MTLKTTPKTNSTLYINTVNPRRGGVYPWVRPDLGADHDELKERAYMKRQMDARRKIRSGDYVAGSKRYRHIDVDAAVDGLMEIINGVDNESR